MAISTYIMKPPEYKVAKYYGPKSMDDICELAGTSVFAITQDQHGASILTIAGLTLKNQQLLVMDSTGLLSVFDGTDFWPYFKEVKA